MERLKLNLNTIYILWLRQIKRHFRSKVRVLASLGQPLLFLIAFGFGFGPIYEQAGGGDFIQFLAPGIIAMSIMFSSMFSGIEVITDRRFGFLKETLVAPITRTSIMLGRTLGGATTSMFQGFAVFIISLLIGFSPVSLSMIPISLFYMLLVALLFTGIGISFASMFEDMQAFPIIMNFFIMPIFFLSGALFPLEGLPSGIKLVTRLNPLSYGVDGIRGALSGLMHFSYLENSLVLILSVSIILSIGAYLFTKIEA